MAQLAFTKSTLADEENTENVRPGDAALGPVAASAFEATLSASADADGAEAQDESDKMALSDEEVPAGEARPEDKMDDDENPF